MAHGLVDEAPLPFCNCEHSQGLVSLTKGLEQPVIIPKK